MYEFLSRVKNMPDWFHVAYVTDWALACILYALTLWIDTVPVFERDFLVDDPMINHPHTKQRVSHLLLNILSLYIPSILVFAIGGLKRSLIALHHGCLGLWLAVCAQSFVVQALKNRVGRLRPDFLARCKWDVILKACTGHNNDIHDGRRSFPSGHSSLAFAGLTFMSLLLGNHLCAFRLQSTSPIRHNFLVSRALRLFISLSPLGVATWVAVTRLEDYRHHKEDVITGGFIGAICAYVSYNIYWYNPFSEGDLGPRNVYASNVPELHTGYELADLEEPPNNV